MLHVTCSTDVTCSKLIYLLIFAIKFSMKHEKVNLDI